MNYTPERKTPEALANEFFLLSIDKTVPEREREKERFKIMKEILLRDRTTLRKFHFHYFKLLDKHNKLKHYYIVTFTLAKDHQNYDGIEEFIKSDIKRSALKISKAVLSREYTKNGRAHWHAVVQTTRYLKKELFKYYIKTFGFIDITKKKERDFSSMLDYISKESTPMTVL